MTLHLFVRLDTGAKTLEAGRALAECGPPSRAEEGCLEYRTFRGADGEALFLKEEWASQAALDEHMQTPHFLKFKNEIEGIFGKPFSEVGTLWKTEPLED